MKADGADWPEAQIFHWKFATYMFPLYIYLCSDLKKIVINVIVIKQAYLSSKQ